ncbi:ubiquitin-associated protein 1-like [Chanos chanos]|uniref:Ubiquitin-associated protein 1-like n=1 Tax=Chanos chanos TaxID=29144 RepID=A0A6J2UTV8_CHACN|nr:ubiquitin-associated protein 1-like [Chanos chanos]
MACLDEVPFKIPLCPLEEAREEVKVVTAPEISMPDYLKILQETEYAFRLENWVLTGLQGGYPSNPRSSFTSSFSDIPPSCPPYWMMFSSPQESRLASRWNSDFWEPNPRPRSISLNAAHLRSMNERVKFTISDSEDDDEYARDESGQLSKGKACDGSGSAHQSPRSKDPKNPGSSSNLSLPSQCCLSQRRKNLRQSSLFVQEPQRGSLQRSLTSVNKNCSLSSHSTPASSSSHARSESRASVPSPGLLPASSRPLSSHATGLDSSVELLSALSPEERELLEAVTEQGYPLRTAIIALQRTGQQSPEQILSYLVAYEHLCELGYDVAQVEEALEMFQNCETKAEEFLHLLTQFNEMGFQQNAIKEVLLVHENHRERALEELMTRVA